MRFVLFLVLLCCFTCDVNSYKVELSTKSDSNIKLYDGSNVQVHNVISWKVPRHILIVGDSEACAVGMYVDQVAKKISHDTQQPDDDISIDCKNGTTVEYWSLQGNFNKALLKNQDVDTVIIFLGTNHYWNANQIPDTTSIIELVKERGLNCIWVGNTAVNGKHWNINKLLRNVVIPTCDYFDTEEANIPLIDNVHPTKIGAIKWINEIWKMIPSKYEENDE